MRLRERDVEIMRLLKAARWLSTSQLKKRFWSHATADAARKRLRKLTDSGYLRAHQEHQMKEILFALSQEGRAELERLGSEALTLESKPPKQREHFLAVNDVRIAAELTGRLDFFFGYWELPGIGWQYAVIPDALFSIEGRKIAVEVDRGRETTKYFVKSKMKGYREGLRALTLERLLIVTDRKARMLSLAERIGNSRFVLYGLLEDIRRFGIEAPVFIRFPGEENENLVKELSYPTLLSSRELLTT